MSIIEAAAMRCRTLADGSLRVEFEVEPRHAQAAFALFGAPGTPAALAALKVASAAPSPAPGPSDEASAETGKAKGGTLARLAGIWCNEADFQEWLYANFMATWIANDRAGTAAQTAASVLRAVLSIESRAELDNDSQAEARFHKLIREPYIARGVTA